MNVALNMKLINETGSNDCGACINSCLHWCWVCRVSYLWCKWVCLCIIIIFMTVAWCSQCSPAHSWSLTYSCLPQSTLFPGSLLPHQSHIFSAVVWLCPAAGACRTFSSWNSLALLNWLGFAQCFLDYAALSNINIETTLPSPDEVRK